MIKYPFAIVMILIGCLVEVLATIPIWIIRAAIGGWLAAWDRTDKYMAEMDLEVEKHDAKTR